MRRWFVEAGIVWSRDRNDVVNDTSRNGLPTLATLAVACIERGDWPVTAVWVLLEE